MGNSTIHIDSDLLNGSTTVGYNGHFRDLPHGRDVEVNEAELGVLINSNVKFRIVGGEPVAAPATAGEVERGFSASPVMAPPVRENAADISDPAKATEKGPARVGAAEIAAANAGTSNADNSKDAEGDLNAKPFSAATTLGQPIAKITEDMDEFTSRQVDALIKAESGAESPRSTLIAALEKKRAALAEA